MHERDQELIARVARSLGELVDLTRRNGEDSNRQNRLILYATIATGVVVFVYTLITAAIWVATLGANDIGRKSFVTSQRAYVTLNRVDLKPIGGSIDIVPVWENAGNTIAEIKVASLGIMASRAELPDGFSSIEADDGTRFSLGPKEAMGVSFQQLPVPCLQHSETYPYFYIWGVIKYRDGLTEQDHQSRFCYRPTKFDLSSDRAAFSYVMCKEGNCVDDECPAPPQPPPQLPASDCQGALTAPRK
jgi:hypothetical protein